MADVNVKCEKCGKSYERDTGITVLPVCPHCGAMKEYASTYVDQSISDVQLLLNMMVCEDQENQKICEEILHNIADRLGKALFIMRGFAAITE